MGERLNYYNPKKEASFSGAHRFPKATQQWLQSQDTYTLHKPVRKNFKRRKTIVPGANFQMQADLIDFFCSSRTTIIINTFWWLLTCFRKKPLPLT